MSSLERVCTGLEIEIFNNQTASVDSSRAMLIAQHESADRRALKIVCKLSPPKPRKNIKLLPSDLTVKTTDFWYNNVQSVDLKSYADFG